jgi:uncharacterized membrane protein YtjA (UPF0391 family)
MLTWAIIALFVSIIAGALGFTGVAQGTAKIAKILFGLFLIVALVLFLLFFLGLGALA